MKKFIFALITSLPALSFGSWIELGYNQEMGVTVYIDPHVRQSRSDRKLARTMFDFQAVNHEFKKPHLSEIEGNEFDCKNNLVRSPEILWYSAHKGTGKVIWQTKNLDWQPVPPGSAYWEIMRQACTA